MGYTIGVSLRQSDAQVLILDAAGHKVATHMLKTDGPLESLPDLLRHALDSWVKRADGPRGRLLGIGVGAPGAIDASEGRILHSTLLKADDVPLGTLLAAQFGCSVLVDHDARLAAVAEATEGAGQNVSHFLLFLINPRWNAPTLELRSYGSALFLDGRVYRGAHSAAGEMDRRLAPHRDLIGGQADLEALTTADAPLTPLLTEVGALAADSIATIVNLLDVQRVILGGTFGVPNLQLVERIRDLVSERLITGPDRRLEIVSSRGGAEAIARGAAISAFNLILENGSLLNSPVAEHSPTSMVDQVDFSAMAE
jgi:predicted NBD/HSP70 family sugar kinase